MGLIMRGGPSGNREDSIPSLPGGAPEYRYGTQAASLPSTVNFGGGTSGNREDAKPNVTVAYDHQEPQDTKSMSDATPGAWTYQCTGNREGPSDPMPGGGSPEDSAA